MTEVRFEGSIDVSTLVTLSEPHAAYLRLMAEASGRSVQDELEVIVDNAIRTYAHLGAKEADNRTKPL